jgi:RNA ligase (TIGR02306 family)
MSRLIVEVCEVLKVEKHPNADRLAIATVKGWKICIPYNPVTGEAQFRVGDTCVYFPPDCVMPPDLSEKLGIRKYLALLRKGPDGTRPPGFRVLAARLRGMASYGVIIPVADHSDWKTGDNVAEFYGITKWEPPEDSIDADSEPPHGAFHRYTEIEVWANFPDVLQEGEEVVITEKIHGKNCRIGLIRSADENGYPRWEFMCGSHDARRKEIDSKGEQSLFWKVLTPQVKAMLTHLSASARNTVAFGEVYGPGVQDMQYGISAGSHGYRLFDISIDGQYLGYDQKAAVCRQFGIEMVPVLYRGPYGALLVRELTDGSTTICAPDKAGPFKGREGVVITPVKERLAVTSSLVARAILKSVSADYLARKGGTDSH